MVTIVLVLVLLFFVVYKSKRLDSNQKKLLGLYLSVWCIAVILASFGFFDMNEPSIFSRNLVLLHLVGFIFGTLVLPTSMANKTNSKTDNTALIELKMLRIINSNVFRVLLILMSIYATYLFSKYLNKVFYYNNLSDTRDDFIAIYGSFYYIFTRSLLFLPMSVLCYVLFGYAIIRKRDWVCWLMGYFLLLNASFTGGRVGYVYILLGIVFVNFFIIKGRVAKYVLGMLGLVVVAFSLIVVVTAFRQGVVSFDKDNISLGLEIASEQFITYLTGSQAAFDYAIDNHYLQIAGGYGYGIFTFSPLVNFINLFTSTIGGIDIAPRLIKFTSYIEENQIFLGGLMGWNALYTSVLFYYIDGGVLGVFFYPFLMGIFFSFIIKKMLKGGSAFLCALACFFFICMIKSVFKFEIFYAYDTFILLVMYYVGSRMKI